MLVHSYTICTSVHEQEHTLTQTHITVLLAHRQRPVTRRRLSRRRRPIAGNDLVGPEVSTVATQGRLCLRSLETTLSPLRRWRRKDGSTSACQETALKYGTDASCPWTTAGVDELALSGRRRCYPGRQRPVWPCLGRP
jgi:hypothetical protein